MHKRELLLKRLEGISRSLQASGRALALLGLGSVGLETGRLDEFSDLDFFVVARDGATPSFLESLEWLAAVAPIAYAYRNTADGHKVLFEDGVFCEFAVFEARELSRIPFAHGRLVWREEGFDDTVCVPRRVAGRAPSSPEWLLGEALTSLYVGLCRLRRGEKLAAMRAIQVLAVSHTLELAVTVEEPTPVPPDPFCHGAPLRAALPRAGSRAVLLHAGVRRQPRIRSRDPGVPRAALRGQPGDGRCYPRAQRPVPR
jgi:lincosamide nucleotidyltransferase